MEQTITIELPSVISVKDLAQKLGIPVTQLIAMLIKNGIMATINESLDFETAAIITEEFGQSATLSQKPVTTPITTNKAVLELRAPVVTVMGHVDHGKTTLLDTIREANVVAGESGGITQHIGAYQVEVQDKTSKKKRQITFLDTPGHAAFTAMRQHGANITDIVVLVVASDDGVKPQTIEAIDHAKQANVPIIVAITKMDQPGANPDRIKQQLAELELVPEDWGGKTPIVPVSAKRKEGIDVLLEMILLVSDLRELKAHATGKAAGVVVESHLQAGKGPVATILIQNGTLHIGDNVTIGTTFGKLRSIESFLGKRVDYAGPSTPVVISGLKNVPQFGEQMVVTDTEKEAKESAERYSREGQKGKVHSLHHSSLEETVTDESIEQKQLPLIVKADVKGSLEAVTKVLEDLGNQEVSVKIAHEGVGPINESDVTMARATKSSILAFRVPVVTAIRSLAEQEKVIISYYEVIYDLVEDAQKALTKLLPPENVEVIDASAKVIALFRGNKKNQVVGVQIDEGTIKKGATFRIMRGKESVGEGIVLNLRRGKEEVKELEPGQQAGVSIPGTLEVKEKDVLQLFHTEVHERSL